MAQTLVIGLGGTGSRAVNNLVKELQANGKSINDGDICCAVLDTNANDNGSIVNSGTGVPVIPTSRNLTIRDYLDTYYHQGIDEWCPQSPAFLKEGTINGASEVRIKSRIAFMDACETGVINQLKQSLNTLLKNGIGSHIRIMIVSSLAGGTGSGMFIQVALWLRKFFKGHEITIRGIFLLPDVFAETLADVKRNKVTKVRHYCNTYAAIQELNTITKIKIGGDITLAEKITLGDLFDSDKDRGDGEPVYDFAFFVDYQDKNGVALNQSSDYEKVVAQLIYMQLYAPMSDDMYSEEDNAFLEFTNKEEPLYGSCGTAKAVYPRKSVKSYCALRAAQDSLRGGWEKIDIEIQALLDEKEQERRDGIFSDETIDERYKYIELFEQKISVKPEEAGKDRFFISIAKDVKNQTVKPGEKGKSQIVESDKVDDFYKKVEGEKVDAAVETHNGLDDYRIDAESFVLEDHTQSDLKAMIADYDTGVEEAVISFEKKVETHADRIVNAVFPYSMGDVNCKNACSIYGLLSKKDENDNWHFIHPVAARYVLYKLLRKLEQKNATIKQELNRDFALAGGEPGAKFDNRETKETETSADALLDSRRWYQNKDKFLDNFETIYAQFINTKVELCTQYEKQILQLEVNKKLIGRVNCLLEKMESFFRTLGDVQVKLKDTIQKNIEETNGIVGKTLYVFGDAASKEYIYRSLNMNLDNSGDEVNENLIDAVYGCVCAEKRESIPENAKYKDISVTGAFAIGLVNYFRQQIDANKNNSEHINLDIYTAICRESDARQQKKEEEQRKREREEGKIEDSYTGMDGVDLESTEIKKDASQQERHKQAFLTCKETLCELAAPLLRYNKEKSDNTLGTITTREKIFWGFSPDLIKCCPHLGQALEVNVELQADPAYFKNELYCYSAVYGLAAKYIPKFNELNPDGYYEAYKKVVDEMVTDYEGRKKERALVHTPHLDKNWHRILPAINEETQYQKDRVFYRGFWLAIAYGKLKTDKDGNMIINRPVDVGFGNLADKDIPLTYQGKNLTKTDVTKILTALRADTAFAATNIPALEKQFKEECEDMDNYTDTDVMKGLLYATEDLHPVDFLSRYVEARKHDKTVAMYLLDALESIMYDLVASYNTDRSEQKLEKTKCERCKAIYDSSKRIKGKAEAFAKWEKDFKKYNIKA